ALTHPNIYAFGIGAMTLALVFFWPKKISRFVPGPLAALLAGTLISFTLPDVPVLGDIPSGLPPFVMPSFSAETGMVVLQAAFILALLGAIDSLLTSLVSDSMTRTRHDSNKELIGQGVGNAVAGFFDGVPG